jgi:hypothetical protein
MAKADGIVWFGTLDGIPVVHKHEGRDLIAVSHEFLDCGGDYIKHLDSIMFMLAGCIFVYVGENEDMANSSIYRVHKPAPVTQNA